MSRHTDCGNLDIADALLILFLYLKLTHQIDWSYWWVLSPIYFTLAILIVAACLEDK